MFTLQQIQDAHAKVKSGADFPHYIHDLIVLWVRSYTIFVSDGHAEYQGDDNYMITSLAKYEPLDIRTTTDKEWFANKLKLHQQGGTDYMTFCHDAAQWGILKWVIDMESMTCSYYDYNNAKIIVEDIPRV